MSEQPYMQLWIADYLGDTQHLTAEQSGCYLHLLMCMWRAGGYLQNDDTKLARMARVSLERWREIRDDVMAFFQIANARICQKRLLAELERAKRKSEQRKQAGSRGGKAKALNNKKEPIANATVLPVANAKQNPTIYQNQNHLATNVAKRERRAHALPPDWSPSENHLREGEKLGFPVPEVDGMAEDMRLWAGAKGETKKNWDMAFSGWMRREKKQPRGHGPPRQSNTTEAGERLLKDIRSGKFGPGICDEGGSDVARQLSKPATRSRYPPAPTNDLLHREAEDVTPEDG